MQLIGRLPDGDGPVDLRRVGTGRKEFAFDPLQRALSKGMRQVGPRQVRMSTDAPIKKLAAHRCQRYAAERAAAQSEGDQRSAQQGRRGALDLIVVAADPVI